MEASAAGLATGEAEAPQAEQAPQGDAAIAQLAQQLEGLQQGQEETRQFLQSNPWAPQPEEEPEPAPDLSFLDETNPNYDPNVAAQRLQEVMKQEATSAADAKLQEAIAPLQQQVQELRSQQGADALAAEFPEMKDPKVAQQVVETAEKYAQILNQPELLSNFDFIRMTYMAGRAAQLAQEEGDGSPQAATLEGAGGASPGGAAQGTEQLADQITQNWGKSNQLWGGR